MQNQKTSAHPQTDPPAAGGHMSRRRESAYTLVQRLKATPVALLPPIFHNALDGGLRQGETLVVGGGTGSGKKKWVYRVAAQHLSSGGAVTFVFFPGSGNFMMRCFMERLEECTQHADPFPLETAAHASFIEKRRKVLLEALDRLEVVHCIDITDLAVFCMHRDAKARTGLNFTTVVSPEMTPLVVAVGCGGRGSHLHHMERAMGHEVPLCHWLFGLLQRRRRCALLLIEEWGSVKAEEFLSHDVEHRQSSSLRRDTCPFVSTVETKSEILRRLQCETSKVAEKSLQLPVKGKKGSLAALTPASAASSCLATDAFSHFMGNLRIFFLYTQAVPASAHQIVSVARLFRWRLMKAHTDDEEGTRIEVSTEPPRKSFWRKPRNNTLSLQGEMLCGAQL